MWRQACLLILLSLTGCGGPRIPDEFTVSGKPLDYWLDMLSDAQPEMRARAVRALGNVGPADPDVIPALTKALTDPDPGIRGQAALALLKFGPAAIEAIPALTAAQADRDKNVRHLVTQALTKIQGK